MDFKELRKKNALKDPENVTVLHDIIGTHLNLADKKKETFYRSALSAAPDRKPNMVFDVTLKDLQKLANISRALDQLGYDKSNIHIVWVVNDIEVAKKQNVSRSRTVPVEILMN